MDSFELNKIAGAVLAAVLLIVASRTFIEIAHEPHGGGEHAVVGYELPKPAGEAAADHGAATAEAGATAETAAAGATAEAPATGFDAAKVAALVAAANADKGAKLFNKCKACHTSEKGGADKVGPHLWGVVGRPKGSVADFKYSEGMKAKGGDWDNENLAHFLHKPKEFIEGTKMIFTGSPNDSDLADIVAYLNTLK